MSVAQFLRFALLLITLSGASFLNGCTTSDDPDDRTFFNRGWINPKELDTDENFNRIDPRTKKPLPPPNYVRDPLVD